MMMMMMMMMMKHEDVVHLIKPINQSANQSSNGRTAKEADRQTDGWIETEREREEREKRERKNTHMVDTHAH